MFLLPLVATFLGSVALITPIARLYGQRGGAVISLTCSFVAFLSSVLIWFEVSLGGSEVYLNLFGTWFSSGSFHVLWNVYIDLVTAHMLLTVSSVSFAVHCYAVVYMRSDPHLNLFMGYLSLFTFFMIVLVCSDNLIGLLLGWEGIGVCSYLLIGYWSHRLSAIKSAQKAILVNRVSDGLLLWGILWVWWYTGTLEYDLVTVLCGSSENTLSNLPPLEAGWGFAPDPLKGAGVSHSTFLSLAILIGAMGKSAQIGFHVWLADAMEGPTPVSALIHAATLVTAGVYVMVRLSVFYDSLIIIVGALTAFMAGIFGYFQADLKRVIAFSTCSQLGYMMVSIGLSEHGADAAMCHLMTHASFKAALFLAAGVIIMSSNGSQQLTRYGSLSATHCSALCFLTLLVGCICLMGMPETSGFYSKETIINLSFVEFNPISDLAHTLLIVSAFITCTYTAKLFIQSFLYDFSGNNLTINPLNPRSFWLIGVAFTVLIADIVFKIYVGTNLLSGVLFFIPWGVKTLPVGLMIAGILTATTAASSSSFPVVRFCATRWGFDQLYARTIVHLILDWGRITWASADKGLFIMNNQKVRL